jgi:hypothetical protein
VSLFRTRRHAVAASLPVEGHLPGFEGATGWVNSEPLTNDELLGSVVLVDFWTYTCINWLRTLGYIRAWDAKYRSNGLAVIGVHTPEFPFEHDVENVRRAMKDMRVEYAVAIDSDHAVWRAFANHYWPAVYIADTEGRIRHHQFGEGGYDECEEVIHLLLRDAGRAGIADDLVDIDPDGFEAQADWANLETPETYLGYEQAERFATAGSSSVDEPRSYAAPDRLERNHWALSGGWTIGGRAVVLNEAGGRIAFRFHARDVNLVMGPPEPAASVPFRVLVDGEPPGGARGLDVDEQGNGMLDQQRLYQLVRERGPITDRTFEIAFAAPGAEAYAFTFG